MNAYPAVRRHFPTVLGGEQANAEAQRCRDAIAERGWGMWALEVPGVFDFAGMRNNPADDFDHPRVADGHPLRRHLLYRVPRPQ